MQVASTIRTWWGDQKTLHGVLGIAIIGVGLIAFAVGVVLLMGVMIQWGLYALVSLGLLPYGV